MHPVRSGQTGSSPTIRGTGEGYRGARGTGWKADRCLQTAEPLATACDDPGRLGQPPSAGRHRIPSDGEPVPGLVGFLRRHTARYLWAAAVKTRTLADLQCLWDHHADHIATDEADGYNSRISSLQMGPLLRIGHGRACRAYTITD